MPSDSTFVDYYAILEAGPTCSARALEAAYHELAKRYHPDHAEQADIEKFTAVVAAYKALKEPQDRATYDLLYAEKTGFRFEQSSDELAGEWVAYSDADAHSRILQMLYQQRREHAQDPGVGRYLVRDMLHCSDQAFEFHIWYLKEKRLILTTEQGTLAITIEGVDHVISTSRIAVKEKLLLMKSDVEPDDRFD